jgi:predicted nucleic acid-binding protein
MIEFESIFIDTSPLIYLIENHPKYGAIVDNFIEEKFYKEALFTTSVISISEFQVGPKKKKLSQPVEDLDLLLAKFHFMIFNITREIADIASSMRAKYQFLHGMDSFQIALAVQHNCKIFFTNDAQLKSIREVNIILVNDLI